MVSRAINSIAKTPLSGKSTWTVCACPCPRIFLCFKLAPCLCDGDDADLWADLFINLSEEGVYCTLDPNVRAVFVKDRASHVARIERMIAAASLVKSV